MCLCFKKKWKDIESAPFSIRVLLFMKHKSKFIGSVLIVAGTAFGAGMLALPLVASRVGFLDSTVLLVFLWAEDCFIQPFLFWRLISVYTFIKTVLLPWHPRLLVFLGNYRYLAWFFIVTLCPTIISAYIAGDASVLSVFLKEEFSLNAPLISFVPYYLPQCLVNGIVPNGVRTAVDIVNRG